MKLRKVLSWLRASSWLGRRARQPEPSFPDYYVSGFPSAQSAIDLIPGWNNAFPEHFGVTAGHAHLHEDPRIHWCLEQAGSLEGRTVLELGPLEGMHSYMLARAGAARVDAVEANSLAFLRCLVSKEILQLKNVSFLLGDFRAWMDDSGKTYDLTVASGVLYHSSDPLGLLRSIASSSDSFYIWTHYYDQRLADPSDLRGYAFSGRTISEQFDGIPVTLHERSYHKAWSDPKFCGGLQDTHFWLERPDIEKLVAALGFETRTAHEEVDHPNGPAFSLFARRRKLSTTEDGVPPSAAGTAN